MHRTRTSSSYRARILCSTVLTNTFIKFDEARSTRTRTHTGLAHWTPKTVLDGSPWYSIFAFPPTGFTNTMRGPLGCSILQSTRTHFLPHNPTLYPEHFALVRVVRDLYINPGSKFLIPPVASNGRGKLLKVEVCVHHLPPGIVPVYSAVAVPRAPDFRSQQLLQYCTPCEYPLRLVTAIIIQAIIIL